MSLQASTDFRGVDLQQLRWGLAGPSSKPVARLGTHGRVVVQTPCCPCRVSLAGPGMYRADIRLRSDVAIHDEFATWICDIEESAAECEDLAHWREGKSLSSCVYNGSMRLMIFSNVLTFDDKGALSSGFLDAAWCACLVELQGTWGTDSRWGLRWKVIQMKFGKEPLDLPLAIRTESDDSDVPVTHAAQTFAFLEDDDS